MSELRTQRYWRNRSPEERVRNTNVPKRFRQETLDTFKPTHEADKVTMVHIKNWVESAKDRVDLGQGLYICGGTGSGKTHLAQAILKRAVHEFDISGMFVTTDEYMQMYDNKIAFKNDYPDGYEDPNTLRYLLEVFDLVVLDSLGLERNTDASRREIIRLITTRYNNQLATIITSTLKPQQLADVYSSSVASIVKDSCYLIPLKGTDYRIGKWMDNAGK